LPNVDLVLVGARVKGIDDTWRWQAFDRAANACIEVKLDGEDPVGKAGAFNNSIGLMYGPARKLVWAVGQHSHVHVRRFDPKSASTERLR
jgi:hypothetical protein